MIRAVLDANVLVSPNGVPGRVLSASERLVAELEDVLAREKFRRYATVEQSGRTRPPRAGGGRSGERGRHRAGQPRSQRRLLRGAGARRGGRLSRFRRPHLLGLTLGDLPVVVSRTFLEITDKHG